MRELFAGIDLAWSTGVTGVAVVDYSGRVLSSGRVGTDDEIAAWLGAVPGQLVVAAVDAPPVVPNETGQRLAERLIGQAFSVFGQTGTARPAARGRHTGADLDLLGTDPARSTAPADGVDTTDMAVRTPDEPQRPADRRPRRRHPTQRADSDIRELRALLIERIRSGEGPVTYAHAAARVGRIANGLGPVLSLLEQDCATRGEPNLAVLVVSHATGAPTKYATLGQGWVAEQHRCAQHGWVLAHSTTFPTADEYPGDSWRPGSGPIAQVAATVERAPEPVRAAVTGQAIALAVGLLAAVWVMDATRVRWGSDRAGKVQTATAANSVLFPAAILLPPVLFLAVGLASSASYVKSTSGRPSLVGNACIRVADMSLAAVTFYLLAGDRSLDPSDLRGVAALAASGMAMVCSETVLVVHLTRAWDGLDSRDLPMWAWADLLPAVPQVLVGALICLLYPSPAIVLVIGLIVWSHHSILEHAHLRAASRDDKTGLLSQPAFEDLAAAELDRARRTGHPLAVLLMDLDGLKKVNTDHGHLAGDQYIAGMARLLADASRSYDLVARFGGDEFCLLLPDTPLADATAFAERIRSSATTTSIPGVATPMAVSIGVAAAEPTDDVLTLLATADTALRHAKSHGRNQVVGAPTRQRPPGRGDDLAHSLKERNA